MEAYMNTEKTFETTYFYWELKNGKPTGKLKSKKCKFYEEIGEKVYIVPLQENDKMSSSNCPLFAVRTFEAEKKVYLSYFFKGPNKYITRPYATILDEEESLFYRSLEFNIPEETSLVQESIDIYPIAANFELIPTQVLKFCLEEILRLQGTKDIFPSELKSKLEVLEQQTQY